MKRRIYGFIKCLLFMPFFAALILALVGLFLFLPFMVLIEPRILDDVIDRSEGRK